MRPLFLFLVLLVSAATSSAQDLVWKRVPGLDGGELYQLANVGRTLFLATETGMYRSSSSGRWEPLTNGLPKGAAWQIVALDSVLVTAYNDAVYRSTDLGAHWSATDYPKETSPKLWVKDSVIFGEDETTDIVGAYDGILFASTDLGLTWHGDLDVMTDSDAHRRVGAERIYGYSFITWIDSVGERKVLRTRDNNVYDTVIYEGESPFDPSSVRVLSPKYLIETASSDRGLYTAPKRRYISSDSGRSWSIFALDSDALRVKSDWTKTLGNIILISVRSGVARSTDSGTTWKEFFTGESPQLLEQGGVLYLKGAKWLFESLDSGAHWRTVSCEGIHGEIREVASSNGHLIAKGVNGWQILDRNNWRPFPRLGWSDLADSNVQHGPYPYAFAVATPTAVLAFADSMQLIITYDLGKTWHRQGQTPISYPDLVKVRRPGGHDAVVIVEDSLQYYSLNLGKTWVAGIPPGGVGDSIVTVGRYDYLMFPGTGRGYVHILKVRQSHSYSGLFSGRARTATLGFDSAWDVHTVAAGNDVLVEFNQGRSAAQRMLVSHDGFKTWQQIAEGPPLWDFTASGSRLYAAGSDGVYVLDRVKAPKR